MVESSSEDVLAEVLTLPAAAFNALIEVELLFQTKLRLLHVEDIMVEVIVRSDDVSAKTFAANMRAEVIEMNFIWNVLPVNLNLRLDRNGEKPLKDYNHPLYIGNSWTFDH